MFTVDGDLDEAAAMHAAAVSSLAHLCIGISLSSCCLLEGSKSQGQKAGENVKRVGTGKQCARHLEIILPLVPELRSERAELR